MADETIINGVAVANSLLELTQDELNEFVNDL